MELKENFMVMGNDLSVFREAVSELSDNTETIKVSAEELQIFSALSADDERLTGYLLSKAVLPSETEMFCPAKLKRSLSLSEAIMSDPNTEIMMTELSQSGVILRANGKSFFCSPSVMAQKVALFGVGGSFFERPTLERDIAVLRAIQDRGGDITLICRRGKSDAVKKVFSIQSGGYQYVSQNVLVDIIDRIEKDGKVGQITCDWWSVDHHLTKVMMSFPDKAAEIASSYGISTDMVPCLMLETSDTGTCAVTVRGGWKVRGAASFDTEVTRKHTGDIDIGVLYRRIDESIFDRYRLLPERLCELMLTQITPFGVDLSTDDGMSLNKEAVVETLRHTMSQCGMRATLGKRQTSELLDALALEVDASSTYSAFDIAVILLSVTKRLKGVSNMKEFERTAARAPYVSYATYKPAKISI